MPPVLQAIRGAARRSLLGCTPPRYRLAAEMAIERVMGRLPPELRILPSLAAARATAVDVGANRGHYSRVMSKWFDRVIAFEPNADLTLDLARSGARNLTIHHCALSSSAGERDLYIPLVRGRSLPGFASFERQEIPGCEGHRVLKVPFRKLDDFELENVSLIKINAPGHEREVLEGARRTIQASRPAVIAQVWPESRGVFARVLSGLDLAPHLAAGGRLHLLAEGIERYAGDRIVFVFVRVRR